MQTLPDRPAGYLILMVVLPLIYALSTKGVMNLFMVDHKLLIVWPPSWLSLALLILFGTRIWPGIFLATLTADLILIDSPAAAICMAIGNTMGVVLGISLLARIHRFNHMLENFHDYLWLGIAAAATGGMDAVVSTSALHIAGWVSGVNFMQELLLWAERNTLSIILATPIVLTWQRLPKGWLKRDRITETISCFGLALLTGQMVFLGWLADPLGDYAKAFLMFVFIIWAAVRFGRHGVFLVIAFTGLQALLGAKNGIGFFGDDIERTNLTNLWFYVIVLTDVGLAVDFVMHQLRRSEQRERTRNLILELIARNTPLKNVLQTIVDSVEKENDGLLCCIMVNDNSGKHVFIGNIYSLEECNCPAAQNARIKMQIPAVVADQQTVLDTWWFLFQYPSSDTVDPSTPVSCRIEQIRSQNNQPIGAAVLYRRNNLPQSDEDLRLIAQIANLTSIAIDQKRNNEELQLALMVYQNSSEAMIVTDHNAIILTVNPAFTRLTGYTYEEIIGKNPHILSSGYHDRDFYQSMWESLHNDKQWQGEIWNRRKSGELYLEWLTITSICSKSGADRYVALFSDITQKKASEELIWNQANFDQLTGLPNRSMLLDRLQLSIQKSQNSGNPLALMFIDLDRFKEVNDTLGHSMGDLLIKEAAQRLSACIRESDMLARWGGDEFVIVLESMEPNYAQRVSQTILQNISQPFQLGSDYAYVSASIGISFYPNDAVDIDDLLKAADQAMYATKNGGRNGFSYFTAAMQEVAKIRMRLTNDLHNALAGKQFEVYYQPIVELATGKIAKAEALIRWNHPVAGLISPANFIPIAEETGLICGIGDWVFQNVVQQLAAWRDDGKSEVQISINKSPIQFQNGTKDHSDWHAQLSALGLPGESVVIEITESVLLENSEKVRSQLSKLYLGGMRISLDDFGTGYSSLAYLQKFDIDFLKIDQSFVSNLTHTSNNLALCEAIIVLAHRLGIKVIAEGVETEEQHVLLKQAGCDYGQGYLFSKPLPAVEFGRLLHATS
ncbi:uncharacterized protein NMK_2520 [Novimethylophilus kurashikiensis]|uniref:Diguanylate cyclase n=2 Tax=Novimethylophilus kurashikiensis TaxID=1825523 RepID=A0A2R5FAS3_9PROT|nr:uncharacterized protein NMK_2520 [Novimethylophilus kurashikiensis]